MHLHRERRCLPTRYLEGNRGGGGGRNTGSRWEPNDDDFRNMVIDYLLLKSSRCFAWFEDYQTCGQECPYLFGLADRMLARGNQYFEAASKLQNNRAIIVGETDEEGQSQVTVVIIA